MKYKNEYLETRDRNKFIKLLLKKYINIKRSTAERRWSDCVRFVAIPKYNAEEKKQPVMQKMLILDDMIKYKQPITKENLEKYGFNIYEINWIEDEGYIKKYGKYKKHTSTV